MCLSSRQSVALKRRDEHFSATASPVSLASLRVDDKQRGFTMVEMIMAIVIVGILAAIVAPRFSDNNVFQSRGFADQVQATLRYAQKAAIAQHRLVCVALTSSSVTLTIASTSAAVTCTPPLLLPSGVSSIPAPSGVTLVSYTFANFTFDALGKPSFATNQTITVSSVTNNIVIEAETGYVHSP